MSEILIQVRRGKSTEWDMFNPILAPGEVGLDIDRKVLKFGNGVDTWTKLKSFPDQPDFTPFILF